MLQQHDPANRRHNGLNELTMQSRLMTEDENRVGKKSEWFRVNLTGPVKNFSRTLCQLTYITTLVIKNNNLERLPAELGNLTNLVNLDASCNKLQSLPPTIGDLTELRALILNDNKIVDLPLEIGRLLNLRHFSECHICLMIILKILSFLWLFETVLMHFSSFTIALKMNG
ncbi:CCR4-NOT transcription complex subunit 6 [Paragonimus westermani]|uniref:CCR4-NOT transcription complex subunit 6 n=1 Tax=Paragonimus westermani TaxID=34504 RepID=A0A5J4N5M4_9TREM|nr:CCR4-NOT transcription complex subunit 6 [Paragonimus westermani]